MDMNDKYKIHHSGYGAGVGYVIRMVQKGLELELYLPSFTSLSNGGRLGVHCIILYTFLCVLKTIYFKGCINV